MIRVLPDRSNVYFIGGQSFIIPHQVQECIYAMEKHDQGRIDKLASELNRLKWHYPDKGELPEIDEGFVSIIIEYTTSVLEIDKLYESNDKKLFFENVARWRYIE